MYAVQRACRGWEAVAVWLTSVCPGAESRFWGRMQDEDGAVACFGTAEVWLRGYVGGIWIAPARMQVRD